MYKIENNSELNFLFNYKFIEWIICSVELEALEFKNLVKVNY